MSRSCEPWISHSGASTFPSDLCWNWLLWRYHSKLHQSGEPSAWHLEGFWWVNFEINFVNWSFQASFYFLDQQLWSYSETTMTLKNSRGDWIYENKTWTVPKENGEGYITELENNSTVLSFMDGKSIVFLSICIFLKIILHTSITRWFSLGLKGW